MKVFRDIDLKPNLIPYADFCSKPICGLGSGFIEETLTNWDENQAFIMPSALRKIEHFDSYVKVDFFDTEHLFFICHNKQGKQTMVKLYKNERESNLPLIGVAAGRVRKTYEVTYSNDLQKLYLNLLSLKLKFGSEAEPVFIDRTISCKEIELRMKKKDITIHIKITRDQDSYNSHFILHDEKYFLRDLADSENYNDINFVWEYILLRSKLDFRELSLEITIYETKNEETRKIGKVKIFDGKLFSYKKKVGDVNGEPVFYKLNEETKEFSLSTDSTDFEDGLDCNTDYVRELILASNIGNV